MAPIREYDENGEFTSESVYEYGILVRRSDRGADGSPLQVYRIADDSPKRELLERLREENGWPGTG